MIVVLLLLHGLLAVALLGAITHQALSVAAAGGGERSTNLRRPLPWRQRPGVRDSDRGASSSSPPSAARCSTRSTASTCVRHSRTCRMRPRTASSKSRSTSWRLASGSCRRTGSSGSSHLRESRRPGSDVAPRAHVAARVLRLVGLHRGTRAQQHHGGCCREAPALKIFSHAVRRVLSSPPSISTWPCSGITRRPAQFHWMRDRRDRRGILWYGWIVDGRSRQCGHRVRRSAASRRPSLAALGLDYHDARRGRHAHLRTSMVCVRRGERI